MSSVRKLGVEDTSRLIALRREALESEPLAFAASVTDDIALVAESVRDFLASPDTQAVYGAFQGADLIGMAGLFRLSKSKQAHKAMIWGMYVRPGFRKAGVGRALLNAAIEQARVWSVDQLQLSVTEPAVVARHLYESAGFRVWGTEPRAQQWNCQFVAEHHLFLDLGNSS